MHKSQKREEKPKAFHNFSARLKAGAGLKRAAAAPEERNPACSSDICNRHSLFYPLAHALLRLSVLAEEARAIRGARSKHLFTIIIILVFGCRRDCYCVTPTPRH
jgi:hypothetical protein